MLTLEIITTLGLARSTDLQSLKPIDDYTTLERTVVY
jgi:hypothetical protein